MQNNSLRKYLFDKRNELQEKLVEMYNYGDNHIYTSDDLAKIENLNSQLNIIKEVITLCITRRRY